MNQVYKFLCAFSLLLASSHCSYSLPCIVFVLCISGFVCNLCVSFVGMTNLHFYRISVAAIANALHKILRSVRIHCGAKRIGFMARRKRTRCVKIWNSTLHVNQVEYRHFLNLWPPKITHGGEVHTGKPLKETDSVTYSCRVCCK